MAKFYDALTDDLQQFIAAQKIFFTATAASAGRVKLSPKGTDSFRVLDGRRVAFLNLTGSGNETAAHLAVNGRITLMFCSFAERPLILRIYGRGRAVHRHDPTWDELYAHFPPAVGARQVVVIDVESVQTSCGFAVPFYEFQGEREALTRWAEHKGEDGIRDYWTQKNRTSIDGLPTGIFAAQESTSQLS